MADLEAPSAGVASASRGLGACLFPLPLPSILDMNDVFAHRSNGRFTLRRTVCAPSPHDVASRRSTRFLARAPLHAFDSVGSTLEEAEKERGNEGGKGEREGRRTEGGGGEKDEAYD